ncbi:hypothetical protein FSP39_015980 [Pinctada imbricata]|uniref:Adhesion G protein-coupled receptor A3 n=1 Tax=Pinctada imbricata TaxID=66713 RepID=A0AA88Y0U6_PINIB|nr:hypothetical protein FSP39_015980 [Pinctada imbricata]
MHFIGILFLCTVLVGWQITKACPPACTCITRKQRDDKRKGDSPKTGQGRKVSCMASLSPITAVSNIRSLPLDTTILDLSKNAITVLKQGDFNQLSRLKKLDLSFNRIVQIEEGAFQGLTNLTKLDLSNNKIGTLNSGMFQGLIRLEKLNLTENRINTIPEGAFNNLLSLKKIEFRSEFLRCDCHLQWIVKWSRDKSVRILTATTCGVPKELKDKALKTLKKKDLHCNRPLELPLFEIYPKQSQVVFEGDKLPFECRASVIDKNTQMVWMRSGRVVETNRSHGIIVRTDNSQDGSLRIHTLVLENLMLNDSGAWRCMVTTPQGNVSNDINIVVISNHAATCPSITTKTKKGVYKWPRTVAGVVSQQPCKRGKGRKALHRCSKKNLWEEVDVTQCEFTDEATRKLQSLAVSRQLNNSVVMRTANNLKMMVSDPTMMSDVTHFMLASQAVQAIASRVPVKEGLSNTILDIVSSLMKVDFGILHESQIKDKSCTRLLKVVENLPSQLKSPTITKFSDFITIETLEFNTADFPGTQCSAYDFTPDYINCGNLSAVHERLTTVNLPRGLFSNGTESPDKDRVRLQLILYKSPKLFPITAYRHDDPVLRHGRSQVVSSVFSVNFSRAVFNVTEPISLVFRVNSPSNNLHAAYWDFTANNGYGDWRTDGCHITDIVDNFTYVHCYHLSIFAILETRVEVVADDRKMLHLMEAVVYVGSCVCLICLMAVIITYVSCFRFINVPKKYKHSVINISVSVLFLIIGFTMGVKRTDHLLACQIVGISIHYLTLCTMFWITITTYNMLKKFTKSKKPPAPPPEPVDMPLPPKPMLRFYFLGWGVPIIICGITAAVSIDHYADPNYCFLAWDPSLGAFYGPVALLLIFNIILFLRIGCVIQDKKEKPTESDQTEEVHDIELTTALDDTNTEIQALTEPGRNNVTRNNEEEFDARSEVSSVMDQEKMPSSQLYSLITILLLYMLFWTCGAITVAEPLKTILPHQVLIFSYLYGVTCAIFGIFMLSYFCLSRKDSFSSWKRFFCCEQQPVFDINYQTANNVRMGNGHVVQGNGSVVTEPMLKTLNITNDVSSNGSKQSNINLVPTNTSSVLEDSVVSAPDNIKIFYNPKQNGVAKKFWDKQRHSSRIITRDMAKDFNLSLTDFSGSEANRHLNNGDLSDEKSHLSIEIQIQPKDLGQLPHGTRSPFSQVHQLHQNGGVVGHMPVFPMLPLDRNQIPPVGGSVTTGATSPCFSSVSHNDSQSVNQQEPRSPSSCSLGSRSHPSAFTPVQPKTNSLPKQQRKSSNSPPAFNDYMIRNGNVTRMRDFDGQSQVSEQIQREPVCAIPGQSHVSPMVLSQTGQPDCTYKQYGSVDDHITFEQPVALSPHHFHRARSHSGGCSSDASAKNRPRTEQSHLQEVQQRVTPNPHHINTSHCKSPVYQLNNSQQRQPYRPYVDNTAPMVQMNHSVNVPVSPYGQNQQPIQNNSLLTTPDSDSGIHYRRYRQNDSDHNSEPPSSRHVNHRSKSKSHNSHRHSRHKGMHKHRQSEWEKESPAKPRSLPYAYVNHNYAERVRQKLQSQSSMDAKNYWGSPSMEDDDTTSSSGDEDAFDHNVWVLQNQKKQKQKKETSV